GSCCDQVERELSRVEVSVWRRLEQLIDGPQMHDVGADQPGEGQWAEADLAGVLDETQEEVGDQGAGDLDAHGVLGAADEVGDLQGLLDPPEEEFDGPAALVEVSDLLGGCVEVIGDDAQGLAVLQGDADLA